MSRRFLILIFGLAAALCGCGDFPNVPVSADRNASDNSGAAGLPATGPAASATAEDFSTAAGPLLPLKVVYLGSENSPRASEFVDFLQTRFEQVAKRNREGLDLESVSTFDVVVLDWSQHETPLEKAKSPLGPRTNWSKPTVLLGSAGLMMSVPWETIGGAG